MKNIRNQILLLSDIDNEETLQDAIDTVSDVAGELSDICDSIEYTTNETLDILKDLNSTTFIDLDDTIKDLENISKILY